ncbi:MAG: rRNA pseudouridine synthase [Gammaproteobacteria bacterium]|nr:rRNA pseudouridine synthase [Gammaproteobacteria bacterium]
MSGTRLSKLMAERGLCSRREADRFIEQGWVKVDGKRIDTLGVKVDPGCKIALAKQAQRRQQFLATFLLNKPIGYVSGAAERRYRTAMSLLEPKYRASIDRSRIPYRTCHRNKLAPAGRLDIESQGLIVYTQDGRIARHLIGPDSEVEKEYVVRITGGLQADTLERLCFGLTLDDKPLKPARVEIVNEDQLRFVLIEGRKRQIRRMCDAVGLTVTGLKRVRIGDVRLAGLPEKTWRYLTPGERF